MNRFEIVEWLLAQGQLSKPANDGWTWPAIIMRAGMSQIQVPTSKLPVYIPREFLAKAAGHFEGAPAYADHQEKGNVRAWAGNWKNVRADGELLLGDLHLLKSEGWLREKLLAGQEVGGHMPGISINAVIGLKKGRRDNAEVLEAQEPIPDTPRTADVVMFPAAGGKILKLAAGEDPEAALAGARAQYQIPGSDAGNSSSGERGKHEKGATMKQTILTLLASLRTLALTDSAKTKAAAIEAGLAQENPKFEELLAQASEIVNAAGAASAASASATQVAALQAQVTTLTEQVKAAQDAQKKADWKLLLASKLTASNLPMPLQNRMRGRLLETPLTAELLEAEIKAERETYAALVPNPTRMSGRPAIIESGLTEFEKLQTALDRMMGVTHVWGEQQDGGMIRMVKGKEIDKAVPAFRGIREAYMAYTGDEDVRGVLAEHYRHKVFAEWNNAGFPEAFAVTLHRLLLQDYAQVDYGVMGLVSESSVPDFKTQTRVRLGYMGDIADVTPETADYAEIAAPTDEKATFAINQKGGIVTVTRKAIINDDLGITGKIVGRLGRALRRTLAQRVTNLFINNAAVYDGDTWFHSNHGNTGTTALAVAELAVIRAAFRAFTEKNSLKKLGLHPLWLMVPDALEAAAIKANQAEYLTDSLADRATTRYMFGQNNERIIINYLLADVTDYYVIGDVNEAPIVEVGYLQGRREPELFLADGETTSERMFLSDKIRYKARHEYECVVTDFRNAYKEVVAG